MEKRTVVFIVVSFVFIMAWDYFFYKKPVDQKQGFSNVSGAAPARTVTENKAKETVPVPAVNTASLTRSVVETAMYKVTVVKESGFFSSLLLKQYKNSIKSNEPVDIFRSGYFEVFDSLYIGASGVRIVYSAVETHDKGDEILLVFTGRAREFDIQKKLILNKKSYVGDVSYTVSTASDVTQKVSIATVISQPKATLDATGEGHPVPNFYEKGSYVVPSERQMKKGYKLEKMSFGGLSEKYFALFVIDPSKTGTAEATLLESGRIDTVLTIFDGNVDKVRPAVANIKFFAGPKSADVLKASGNDLINAIDYGMFHFIARPMVIIMDFLFSFSKNYGISIIILTLLIKIVFFPLSQKSYKSMKEMQKVQPKLDEIRKKYASDKEALNREMMLLYKKHGVNPLSGCLPMVIQIPFFIALYQALMNAIEMRQAVFGFWLQDLSAHDPYYITPILMGATMLLQQMLTPSGGDPFQKKMMYILPVVFTFMFMNFPSGLVLYWLVNNIFSIVQQMYTMKTQNT